MRIEKFKRRREGQGCEWRKLREKTRGTGGEIENVESRQVDRMRQENIKRRQDGQDEEQRKLRGDRRDKVRK